MRYAILLAFLPLLLGCPYSPYAHLLTTNKPKQSDVVGRYVLSKQTVSAEGLSAIKSGACFVELRADGSFTASNVPPWSLDDPGTNFFSTLASGSGKWNIDSVGTVDSGGFSKLKTHWGIYLDSRSINMMPPGLTGKKPPYGLIFTLGDPDCGNSLFLEKTQ